MKKIPIVLLTILVLIVVGILLTHYVLELVEVRSLQDIVLKFVRNVQAGYSKNLREITGGRVFVNLFLGDRVNEQYFEELRNQFSGDSQIKFFRIYKASEFSPEERRKYGFLAWKLNVVVMDERNQYVGGYIFYVSKFTERDESGNEVTLYKIIDISNVGNIVF